MTTILFCFEKKLEATHKYIQTVQQLTLVVLLFAMMLYFCKSESIPTEFYLVLWIWGFMTSHLFLTLKKRLIHPLLGLGILLAITIVLFFKQEEIIETLKQKELTTIGIEIAIVYLILGLLLGIIFWPKTKT